MKKLIILVVSALLFVSCEEDKKVKDYLVLSGNIENLRRRSIQLVGYNFEKRIRFDRKTKSFSDTLRINDGYYTLVVDKNPIPLYLTKTDDTGIIFDTKNRTGFIQFTGKNAKINEYLGQKEKKGKKILGNLTSLYKKDEDDFLTEMNQYKDKLTEYAVGLNLDKSFLEKEVKNVKYQYSLYLNNYEDYHAYLTKNREYVLPESFPTAIKNIDFNSGEDYVNSEAYRTILAEHMEKLASEKAEGSKVEPTIVYMNTVESKITNDVIKNDLLYKTAVKGITYTRNLADFYNKFMKYSTDEEHKKEITELYDKLKLIATGEVSPKFVNYENYEGGKTSLDDLLGKGKYIYIDIWATWCGFCKREIPLMKKLAEDYKDKNVEFVSISIDERRNHAKWKEMIKQREMPGVQLVADKNFESDFMKKYLVKAIPKFILIDPDGKIVSSNAPAPSDSDNTIEDLFRELNIID